MKKVLVSLIYICFISQAFADIIPQGEKSVSYCAKIQNADSFQNVTFVLVIDPVITVPNKRIVISPSVCLSKGYKFNGSNVYAVDSSHLKFTGIDNINFSTDKFSLKSSIQVPALNFTYVPDSSLINNIEELYKVLGFTDSSVIIYLYKRTVSFSNGITDSVFIFNPPLYDNLKKTIESVKVSDSTKNVLIFPNPTQKELNIYIIDGRMGDATFEISDMSGHSLKFARFTKNKSILKKTIDIGSLPAGIYNVRFSLANYYTKNRLILKK